MLLIHYQLAIVSLINFADNSETLFGINISEYPNSQLFKDNQRHILGFVGFLRLSSFDFQKRRIRYNYISMFRLLIKPEIKVYDYKRYFKLIFTPAVQLLEVY